MRISLSLVGCPALLALALAAPACSHPQPTTAAPSPQTAPRNEEDMRFVTSMARHHQQALDLAELVPDRSENDDVKAIASKIHDEQAPEIAQFHRLGQEFSPRPATSDAQETSGHEGHGTGGMGGMVPEQDVEQLKNLSGSKFDKKWIGLMAEHHDGAVKMAQEEVSKGQNPEAKQLAQQIVTAQTEEIADLGALLEKISQNN